jgi:tetratricopeptide (TPR) repeat protein
MRVLRTASFVALLAATLWAVGCGKSAGQYIDRGNQLFSAGQYSEAILNYRNAIKKSPNSGEAYYRLALALLKQNQVNDAYQAMSRAVRLSPKNNAAKAQFASLSLAGYARDPKHPAVLYKQAQSLADQLMEPGGDRMEGLRIKGDLALIDNHPGDAVKYLRQALAIAPNNAAAAGGLAQALLRDNQPEEAERTAREAVQHHPQYAPAYEVLYALYGSEQKWEQAEALLKSWIASNPKDAGPVLRLAAFYYARKQPDDGEKTLNTLLDKRRDFPQADLLVGDFHALIRNREKALADYQRGESRDHEREKVYQERAAAMLSALGRREEALKAADAILAKDARNQFARALKVQTLEQLGGAQNLATAATVAVNLAKEAPANARIQLLAGQALQMKGNPNEAFAYYQQAAKANPRLEAAQVALARLELLRKNYQGVLDHADAALAIRQGDPNARLLRVIGLTGTRSYAAAKTEAEQLARDTKDAPQVQMQLGVIALRQGRYTEAEDLFRKLYKEGSGDVQALAGLVDTYEAQRMPDRALALMQTEAQRSPASTGKAALLVATAEAAGKNDVALSELQKLAAQHPDSGDVQLRIAELQKKRGKLPEALQAYQRARQLQPDRNGVDAAIANVQDELGQKTEAISSYRRALAKTPDDPVVLNNLAFLLADRGGNTDEALQLINTALRKEPNLAQLQDTLAWVHIKRNNAAAALPILASLTRKYPDDPTFHYHYAMALSKKGDRAEAKQQAELALSKKPSSEVEASLRILLAQTK